MHHLSTHYMGMKLENPIIVASSSLSASADGVKKIADAGAGAVVLKSLFEEQIDMETRELESQTGPSWHAEAFDYVRNWGMELGPNTYLKLIESAKKSVSIPVIASLNCVSPRWWGDYAKKLQNAGADGLELNIAFMPSDLGRSSADIEELYYHVVDKVRLMVKIPFAVKIGPYFTSLAHVAETLSRHGVSALVFFNRFYQVDIDTDRVALAHGYKFSHAEEISLPLRWIALLSDRIPCDLAATTGVHDGLGAVKLLLAGASAVQVCSVLYKKGLGQIRVMLDEMESWMKTHGFESVEQFKGKLTSKKGDKPELLERLQYIKALVGIE